MKIHEYQAKQLFRQYGIKTPEGILASSIEEAIKASEKTNFPCVIKAQVHSGARGKAGGIKLAKNIDELKTFSSQIIGMELKSVQTGAESKKVRKVLIEQGIDISKELYLSITLDRASETAVIIASTEGGMDIEKVASETPEKIIKEHINPVFGIQDYNLKNIAYALDVENKKDFCILLKNLYKLFIDKDCSLVEINPLVITKQNELIALDAKINFDDNALFKHPDIVEMRDPDEENPLEVEASKYSLNYIKLDGTIGCMVNGAGLAMTTMDIIKLAGFEPANFLDVGGGASSENIENAFKLLLKDKNVKAVFINIFGGILRCDVLAEGIKHAISKLDITIPIIVRMEGTNKEQGAEILKTSGLKFSVANNLNEAISLLETLKTTVH